MHLDSCKDRVIEEVRRYRFNEPIPGWHGDIRNPSHFGSEDIARYEAAAAFDVRPPPPNAAGPSRMRLMMEKLPRGGPDERNDREVAGIMSGGNRNDSSHMLAGSLVGGGNGNRGVGGGGGGGGSGVLGGNVDGQGGGESGEGGGHHGGYAPLRRPRVSPTTSLFMASHGRSPSAARSESKTGPSPLPRYVVGLNKVQWSPLTRSTAK